MNRILGIDLSFVRQRLPSIPQFSAQFRTHVYSVGSSGGTGSGTIVTDVIKYNDCDILAEFVYRYSKAPDAMRAARASLYWTHRSQRKLRALRPEKPCSYRSYCSLACQTFNP